MIRKRIKTRIILDTNVWISILIGKKIKILQALFNHEYIDLVYSAELIKELRLTSQREKFSKYFSVVDIEELIQIIQLAGTEIFINTKLSICRDKDDDYLLCLVCDSNAQCLVSGDKDLLELNPFRSASIISLKEFDGLLLTESLTKAYESDEDGPIII